jgi:hypothetical protein
LVDAEAVVIEPDARMSSYLRILEQTKPKRGEKKERPPVCAFMSALERRNGGIAGGSLMSPTCSRRGGERRVQT